MVIVDVHASDSFREFASALHHRGVDVVHLRPPYTGRGSGAKRRIDALAGPVVPLPTALEGDDPVALALRRRFLSAPTVDVHATEPVLAALSRTAEWRANPALAKVRPGLTLDQVTDKWDVAQLAAAAGVPVPEATLELRSDRFPAVVKGRLGAGGVCVRIVQDQQSLDAAAQEFEAIGVGPFVERFHPHGTGLGTAGVARDGELLVVGSFERLAAPDEPLQPPIAIRAFHDEAAEALTARLVEALGYTGIVCLNFVPDDTGAPLLIDVNVRIFGSWVTLDALGVPILDTYLDMIGVGPPAPPAAVDPLRWEGVARIGSGMRGSVRAAGLATARTTQLVVRRRRFLGWGWTAAAELRVLQAGANGAIESLRNRPSR